MRRKLRSEVSITGKTAHRTRGHVEPGQTGSGLPVSATRTPLKTEEQKVLKLQSNIRSHHFELQVPVSH